ncbi:MAG: hypothetical protein MZV63_46665 [Marinilabiliales bacterium]|nr:hypothetical protein [Marinilabiliales bacterium]
MTQGTGMALMEEFTRDGGKTDCLNFDKYQIPRMTDMPEMTGIIVENHDPNSLTGAKGIGEPAIELIAPAIANAVYNATGVRYTSMPIRHRCRRICAMNSIHDQRERPHELARRRARTCRSSTTCASRRFMTGTKNGCEKGLCGSLHRRRRRQGRAARAG